MLSPEYSESYNKIYNAVNDYQAQFLPKYISGEISWDEYAKGQEKVKAEDALPYLQKYVDLAKTASGK